MCTFVDPVTGIPSPMAQQFFVDPILGRFPLLNLVSLEGFGGRWAYKELYPYEYIAMKDAGFSGGDYISISEPRAVTWANDISLLL